MTKMKVVILGASGMLGSMVAEWFSRQAAFDTAATVRTPALAEEWRRRVPSVEWRVLDAESVEAPGIADALGGAVWAVNAIGVIKPYIHDDNAAEVERAVCVNALFPHLLARAAEATGCRVLQIATDCVYSGAKGGYVEADKQDALDVYGKTKSLGEVWSGSVFHLRASIIGPEPKAHVSLLDWFLGQKKDAAVNGFTNHQWNGVTTLHFARLCHGIITHEFGALPHLQHAVPTGSISKAELLQCFAREYGRGDVRISPVEAKTVIDRTLATSDAELNRRLWALSGYATPPSVPEMIAELAAVRRLAGNGGN